ncbi:MAG: antibiotic biosynthesis monooxygenase [Acidimicrobiales bacterium]|nr:antibiotic biosynthesis monooxygenase [Acidimicrobiales bacterium]
MLIVAGHFQVDPADRDEFISTKHDAMRETRTEGGCLEYVMSADPIDDSRVMLFERWADQDAFDAHMAAIAARGPGGGPAPKGFSVEIYDVAGVRQFG